MAQPQITFPTATIIPVGFRWTQDAAGKAAAKGAFLRVGGAQVTKRFLSGSKRSWTSTKPDEYRTIFSTDLRITGTPEAVTTALSLAGLTQEQIQEVLARSITRDNFNTTMAAVYNNEIANYEAIKQQKPVPEGYEWDQLIWFGQNIKSAVIATKTGEQRGTVASPGRAGAGESISEKLNKLAPGKVLDVSNMDLNTGRGVRTVTAPKTERSGKYSSGKIPIISNNIDKYIRALQLAYGADAETVYAADIDMVRHLLAGTITQLYTFPAQPVAARVPSPTRVPGQTLASPPRFQAAPVVPRVASPPRAGLGTIGGGGFPNIPPLQGLMQPPRA